MPYGFVLLVLTCLARRSTPSAVTAGGRPELYLRAPDYHPGVPMYDWECGSCGKRFERMEASGTEATGCPACGANASRRITGFALSRQQTANQRRRMEDARGVGRDGARQRFKADIARRRERKTGS